jgi:hypothetical protein
MVASVGGSASRPPKPPPSAIVAKKATKPMAMAEFVVGDSGDEHAEGVHGGDGEAEHEHGNAEVRRGGHVEGDAGDHDGDEDAEQHLRDAIAIRSHSRSASVGCPRPRAPPPAAGGRSGALRRIGMPRTGDLPDHHPLLRGDALNLLHASTGPADTTDASTTAAAGSTRPLIAEAAGDADIAVQPTVSDPDGDQSAPGDTHAAEPVWEARDAGATSGPRGRTAQQRARRRADDPSARPGVSPRRPPSTPKVSHASTTRPQEATIPPTLAARCDLA